MDNLRRGIRVRGRHRFPGGHQKFHLRLGLLVLPADQGCPDTVEIEHMKSKEQKLARDQYAGNSMEKISHNGSDLTPIPSLPPVIHYASPETSVFAVQCYEGSSGSPMNSISGSTLGKSDDGASASSKTKETKILQTRLFRESLAAASHRWHQSPVTRFGESKIILEPTYHNGPNKSGEDDTQILKETCSPIKAMKASLPKQKWVSPPKRLLQEARYTPTQETLAGGKV
ncbi:hypothetical protein OPV22_021916 [Ensete ventricosum]|uniref:DUF4005 domain-containing protein n=1 Tax=Ensete ventricosum TaxID=4639 RepID=A0AAV8QEA9_ENSVE|nr:hypothetical protein OPV22_021916 [Ensete ventricosum]